MDRDDAVWRYYRQPGDKQHIPRRPSYAIVTASEQAKLYMIVHDTLDVFYGVHGKVTARVVLESYSQYLKWKDDLPNRIAKVDTGAQPLPHVLFLQYASRCALLKGVAADFAPVSNSTRPLFYSSCLSCMLIAFRAQSVMR